MQYMPRNRAPVAHRSSPKIATNMQLTDSVNEFCENMDCQHQTRQLGDALSHAFMARCHDYTPQSDSFEDSSLKNHDHWPPQLNLRYGALGGTPKLRMLKRGINGGQWRQIDLSTYFYCITVLEKGNILHWILQGFILLCFKWCKQIHRLSILLLLMYFHLVWLLFSLFLSSW